VNRRTLGRGRLLVSIGALLMLLSMALPWWRHGGSPGLPEVTVTGLAGAGIVVFLAAVLALALVVLPYATADRPLAIDRPASFVVVTALAAIGFVVTLLQIVEPGGLSAVWRPDRSPGLWLAAAGLGLMAWGTSEVLSERRLR
jgi:hypothetical protein